MTDIVNSGHGAASVTPRAARLRRQQVSWRKRRRFWLISGGSVAAIIIAIVLFISSQPAYVVAPEAKKIMAAQEGMKFGILIPSYMPGGFDREAVDLKVDMASGPSGEPQAMLTYRNLGKQAAIFIKQWVPGNPAMETLIKSVPIETKWGKGWLMTQGGKEGIGNIWVSIGQLRVSVSSTNLSIVSPEQLLQMANTMGLASEDQVYTFSMDPVTIHGVAPPPPFIVKPNSEGIQELNLSITPGGYSPIRFLVKKGIPVRINFRAVGEVGCGISGVINQPDNPISIAVTKEKPLSVIDFTPQTAGEFPINCAHNTFRGIMTVVE